MTDFGKHLIDVTVFQDLQFVQESAGLENL